MRFIRFMVLGVCLLVAVAAFANVDKQLWFGFIHQGRVTKHWGYWLDIHHRTKNEFLSNLHVELSRAGVTYFIDDHWRITAGYAFAAQFPSLTNQEFVRLEHRPWQQVMHSYTKGNFRLVHYLRNEQRLIQKTQGEKIIDGYVFRERLRYSVMALLLFNRKKEFKRGSVGIALTNETFVNLYSSDKANRYDQNRAFGCVFYNLTNALQMQLGYMNIFAKTANGNEVVHAVRLFAFYTIDWRNK